MKKIYGLLSLVSLLLIALVPSITVTGETKYRLQGNVYYKDQSGASGTKLEVIENDVVIKSFKTDKSGKYRNDVDLLENHEYILKLSQGKIQTQFIIFSTPDSSETIIKADYTVNKVPVADANGEYTGFLNEPIMFDSQGTNDPDTDALIYLWSFGDGEQSTEQNPSHTYDSPGEYQVTLTVTDVDNGSDIDTTKCLVENQLPVAVLNGPYTVKEKTQITFDSTGSTDPDGEITSYLWDFNDGTTSLEPNPTHVFLTKGDSTVRLTVTDNHGATADDTTKCTVTENKPPVAVVNGPYSCYAEEEIMFDSSGTQDPDDPELSIHWDFGDSTTNTQNNPVHIYNAEGIYTVILTVTDPAGETSIDSTTCTVQPPLPKPPTSEANGPYQGNTHEPIQFYSTGSNDPDGEIQEYLWDFGDGQLSTDSSPIHIYLNEDTYVVSLTVTDNTALVDTDTTTCTTSTPPPVKTIFTPTPNIKPIPEGNGPYTGKSVTPIIFSSQNSYDPDGEITEFLWKFGDGVESTEPNPSHEYEYPGLYNVTLTVTDNQEKTSTYLTKCAVEATNMPPYASINGPYNGKAGQLIQFNSTGTFDLDGIITEYHWVFGDGTSSSEPNPMHSYSETGTYTVSLTITDEKNSENTDETRVEIEDNIPPIPVLYGPISVETGKSITFSGVNSSDVDGEIVEYLFDFADHLLH